MKNLVACAFSLTLSLNVFSMQIQPEITESESVYLVQMNQNSEHLLQNLNQEIEIEQVVSKKGFLRKAGKFMITPFACAPGAILATAGSAASLAVHGTGLILFGTAETGEEAFALVTGSDRVRGGSREQDIQYEMTKDVAESLVDVQKKIITKTLGGKSLCAKVRKL